MGAELKALRHFNAQLVSSQNPQTKTLKPMLKEIPDTKLEIAVYLTFQGDDVMQPVGKRLKTAVSQIYFTAALIIIHKISQIPVESVSNTKETRYAFNKEVTPNAKKTCIQRKVNCSATVRKPKGNYPINAKI